MSEKIFLLNSKNICVYNKEKYIIKTAQKFYIFNIFNINLVKYIKAEKKYFSN